MGHEQEVQSMYVSTFKLTDPTTRGRTSPKFKFQFRRIETTPDAHPGPVRPR